MDLSLITRHPVSWYAAILVSLHHTHDPLPKSPTCETGETESPLEATLSVCPAVTLFAMLAFRLARVTGTFWTSCGMAPLICLTLPSLAG